MSRGVVPFSPFGPNHQELGSGKNTGFMRKSVNGQLMISGIWNYIANVTT